MTSLTTCVEQSASVSGTGLGLNPPGSDPSPFPPLTAALTWSAWGEVWHASSGNPIAHSRDFRADANGVSHFLNLISHFLDGLSVESVRAECHCDCSLSERHSGTPSLNWWIFKYYRVKHAGEVFAAVNRKRDEQTRQQRSAGEDGHLARGKRVNSRLKFITWHKYFFSRMLMWRRVSAGCVDVEVQILKCIVTKQLHAVKSWWAVKVLQAARQSVQCCNQVWNYH